MKKIFTLLTLALLSVGSAWAGDSFEVKFQNSNSITETTSGYFTWNKGEGIAVSWSSKGKHTCTYNDETYSDVIKMESATQVYFTSTAEATVTIVQTTSNATGDKLKFDGTNLDANMANTTVTVDADNTCNIYVITQVATGKHIIKRQSETGLAYVKVEYTGAVMTTLDAPVITVNSSNGEVTIGAVANATKVTYTTDGTTPTAESEEYTAPFTAEDGVTVNAIAIGDGESYMNSEVASQVVLRDDVVLSAPVIKQYNGTVAITCPTVATTIEYSLDGVEYKEYVRAFTLFEDATVYARAKRGEKVSEVASEAVSAITRGAATRTIWMGHGSFANNDKNSMTGAAGDDAYGYTLTITGNSEKKWSSGGAKIAVGSIERTAIKLSNGAQNTLTLPAGVKPTRITFYSFINSAAARTSYWKEFNGEDINAEVPMGAWNNVEDRLTNPDVRVFPLNGDETEITFTNAGEQLCFIIALDVIETASISEAGYATYSNKGEVKVPAGVTAYYAEQKDASTIVLKEIEDGIIPAGEGVVLKADAATYDFVASATEKAKIEGNLLKANLTEGTPADQVYYTLAAGPKFMKSNGGTLAAGKAYLVLPTEAAGEARLNVVFDNETTGIASATTTSTKSDIFNLQGQRVEKAVKGLYIVNGKKVVVK